MDSLAESGAVFVLNGALPNFEWVDGLTAAEMAGALAGGAEGVSTMCEVTEAAEVG